MSECAEYMDICQSLSRKNAKLKAENERLREALEPDGNKYRHTGEYKILISEFDSSGHEYSHTIDVPWTTVKEIMSAIKKQALSGEIA